MPTPKPGEQPMYTGAMDCLRKTIAKEGPFALYKGAVAPLLGIGPVFALYFAAYQTGDNWVRKAKGYSKDHTLSMGEVALCGGLTGVVGTTVLGPAELLKIRQQTAIQQGLDGSFKGVVSAIKKESGGGGLRLVRAFYSGGFATLARDVPASCAWFGSNELAKRQFCENPKAPTPGASLLCGGIAGICNWLVCLPMDTIKTKIQANTGAKIGWLGAASSIAKESGIGGFYRGIAPTLARAFPANAACFFLRDYAQMGLDRLFPTK
eukprot:TRINITY_DN77111_c0_g1_i1.p1 TRINITY_DN77111_c0_g1~~TRINITY_DN77111_c0_g1_i1.p1  ORF type:complete len:307 (-),score=49.08 TRINITY_DN77111_c0_g1_i1:117-911(-)